MERAAYGLERLPRKLLVHVLSLTSPADAFRAAAVSRAFRAAADSDTVWSRFLPLDLPRFAKKELPRYPPSTKKGLFLRLADQPALLPDKFIRMQLDKATGAKCFALSVSTLQFTRFGRWDVWRLIHLGFDPNTRGKRFLRAANISYTRSMEICGSIQINMLSPNSTYAAYMVFKLAGYELDGWDRDAQLLQFDEGAVTVRGQESTRRVCLAGYTDDGHGGRHILLKSTWEKEARSVPDLGEDVAIAQKRPDGWMEVELGEFYHAAGGIDNGHVSMCLRGTNPGTVKTGFTVRSIEVRTI